MNLTDIVVKSAGDKQKFSDWISTALGDEGEVLCERYIKEEIVNDVKFGDQLKITVFATGKEMFLARPYPLSVESERFMNEIVRATGGKDDVPFIISKKTPSPNKPVYYANPVPADYEPKTNNKTEDDEGGDPGPQAE